MYSGKVLVYGSLLVGASSGVSEQPCPPSFVLLHNVTLLKDFHNSGLTNFSLICSQQTSLRLSLPPPPLSSGSVDRTDDSIDYGTSVSEPRAEESDEVRKTR